MSAEAIDMMATNLMTPGPATIGTRGGTSTAARNARRHLIQMLQGTFATEFSLLDAETGDVLVPASVHAEIDWALRGELCRAAARRGQPELVEDEDPLLSLAIPLLTSTDEAVVAFGTFLSRSPTPDESLEPLQQALSLRGARLADWLVRQNPWSADKLLLVARLFSDNLAAQRRVGNLEREVGNLSLHLATTYEEISLLYRLTQNLKLSSKTADMCRLALGWLADVLPVESLAIRLVPLAADDRAAHEVRAESGLLTHGAPLIDEAGFAALIDELGPNANHRPQVLNRSASSAGDWPFPAIRQLIVVPLSEGDNVFGWLAVFNHTSGHELGSVEASLLTSVAAILGIHSGNAELYRQQAEFFAGVVRALTSAIDAKDPYTCGHSDRVARVSVRLAQEMGLDAKQVDTIYLSGLLHDIGKIGIDDTVLRKPGRLTDAEYEHIKTHAEIGFRILDGLTQLDEVLPVVLHHHEQWDGKGYPHGLSGEAIPLMARICAVADAFDAMGSDRPYRQGMAEEKLDGILRDGAGQQWDAGVIEAFFRARADIREISRRDRACRPLAVKQWC